MFFAGMIFGILAFFGFFNLFTTKTVNLAYVLSIFIIIVVLIALIIALFGFKYKNKFISTFKNNLKYFLCFLIAVVVGCVVLFVKVEKIQNYTKFYGEQEIVGVVENIDINENSSKVSIKNVEVSGKNIKGNLVIYFYSGDDSTNLNIGDKIAFTSNITLKELVTDKVNIAQFANDSVYSGFGDINEIVILNNSLKINDIVRQKVKTTLNNSLNEDNATLCYGMLFGDKTQLSEELTQTFSHAGISHIIAVSGLHIGFLVALLCGLLKLCKCKNSIAFVIICLILFFYCYLCDFTPSVLRASFMSIIMLGSIILGERYDSLSSLSLAGIAILLLFPLDLFNVGFQMSFLCVFAIITLAPSVSKLLCNIKIPKLLAQSVAISFCVSLVILPISANAFQYVSLIGIIANVLIIPLFGILYPLLFTTVFLSSLLPFMSFSLQITNGLLHLIKILATFFASINFAHFKIFNVGYLILFATILLCLVMKFLMVNMKVKSIICMFLGLIVAITFIVGVVPKKYSKNLLITYYQYNVTSSVITTTQNHKYLVGYDKYYTKRMLNNCKISKLDGIIACDFQLNQVELYSDICKDYNVECLIIPYNESYNEYTLAKLYEICNVVLLNDNQFVSDITVEFIHYYNVKLGTMLNINNKNIFFANSLTNTRLQFLESVCDKQIYLFIVNESNIDLLNSSIDIENILYHNKKTFEYSSISMENKSWFVLQL